MATLELTRGLVAVVDDCHFDVLNQWKWSSNVKNQKCSYAFRSIHGGKKHVAMHRQIMEMMLDRPLIKGEEVDHIDRNPLNNTASNLRLATSSQQKGNTAKNRGKYRFKGVHYLFAYRNGRKYVRRKPWAAVVTTKHLGYFETEEEAAMAYNVGAIRHFGVFACLNEVAMG